MLEDLDNESKYLESIDNGEENLEIRLENLKKNDWKRMNSLGENDNRLGLVHMGFECSIHDIYNPKFSEGSIQENLRNSRKASWTEDMIWESEDESPAKKPNKRRSMSQKSQKISIDSKIKRKWRFSFADRHEYTQIREDPNTQKKCEKESKKQPTIELYRDVKSRFSDFYDIEFINQVWQMREMRGRLLPASPIERTPSPKKKSIYPATSTNSKFNASRNMSQADSLTIKLSCINDPKSELGSEWNESLMGILEDFVDAPDPIRPKPKMTPNALFTNQRKSYPNLKTEELRFKKPKETVELNQAESMKNGSSSQKNNFSSKKRFRKRKGISGTSSLSEMNGLFEDDLSNLMPELVENMALFSENHVNIPEIKREKTQEETPFDRNEELKHLMTQTSKNWDSQPRILGGPTIITKSIDEPESVKKVGKPVQEVVLTPWQKVVNSENISDKIRQVATNKNLYEKSSKTDRLSHREMAVSTERGLNFLIENWKELGTLKNPPNTLEKFSAKKDKNFKIKTEGDEVVQEVKKSQFENKKSTRAELNPEKMGPDCFKKVVPVNPPKEKKKKEKGTSGFALRKISSGTQPKENDARSHNKKNSETEKSTPQNGKKVQVPLLKYPFSNFYLPNAQKIFTKSSGQFSKTQKASTGNTQPTQKTISDNFILEAAPPKSHRQFSNKKRMRNDALKKKIKMNSKKKNSKELQKILEMKKNLVCGKKGGIEESLRRLKSRKMESKCFQSDRNLSVQKSRLLIT